jgi:subtilisin family serine protease
MTPRWRVAVLDSGSSQAAAEAARFTAVGTRITIQAPLPDRLGHGSRVSAIITGASTRPALLVGQVIDGRGSSTPALVAAAIHWAVACQADLIHLSLGLAADRNILREAVATAIEADCIVVAATPARARTVFPAAYPGVLRGTGDARCTRHELSYLGPGRFGGAPRHGNSGGSSIGAAYLTRAIVTHCPPRSRVDVVEAILAGVASYFGPESRRP